VHSQVGLCSDTVTKHLLHGKTDRRVGVIRGSSAGPVLPLTRRQEVGMLSLSLDGLSGSSVCAV